MLVFTSIREELIVVTRNDNVSSLGIAKRD